MQLIESMLELVDDVKTLLCPSLASFLSRVQVWHLHVTLHAPI
jgi:hypothetical protein